MVQVFQPVYDFACIRMCPVKEQRRGLFNRYASPKKLCHLIVVRLRRVAGSRQPDVACGAYHVLAYAEPASAHRALPWRDEVDKPYGKLDKHLV